MLAAPRDDNPYQSLLYSEVIAAGIDVRYDEGPTGSQTVNLLLAPALLARFRLKGFKILHLHWVFQFSLPWAPNTPWALRLMEWWFGVYLRTATLLGYRIIWTSHDLLPHEQVFADDTRARDFLLSKAAAVIALSEVTAAELTSLGAKNVRVIPEGPRPICTRFHRRPKRHGPASDSSPTTRLHSSSESCLPTKGWISCCLPRSPFPPPRGSSS